MTEHVHAGEWCAACVEHGIAEVVRDHVDLLPLTRRLRTEIARVDRGEEWPDDEWKKGYRHALRVVDGWLHPFRKLA